MEEKIIVTNEYISTLIAIMLASGSLGGLVNYYLARSEKQSQLSLKESVIVGITASFLIPLFLQMGSSNLLREGINNTLSLFVFAGFCLIAAISSRAFISTISERLLREARDKAEVADEKAEMADKKAAEAQKEAKIARAAASHVLQDFEDLEEEIEEAKPPAEVQGNRVSISDSEKAVLLAVYTAPEKRPDLDDILRRGTWQPEELKKILQDLEDRGLLRSRIYEDDRKRWRVRTAGKTLIAHLQMLPI